MCYGCLVQTIWYCYTNQGRRNARKEEGKSRYDLGREKFVERVWKWKKEYGDTIVKQIRSLGASCDWSRERFYIG